jgi:single-strand DNA-binding protein
MYQRLILVGNLGRDPEMRYLPDGTPITNFPMATSQKWNDAQGQLRELTAWFRISVRGKSAEICNQYLTKGRRVLVEGTLTADEKTGGPRLYQRKDGTWGASFEVRATMVRFLSPKGEGAEGGAATVTAPPAVAGAESLTEEELPF